MKKLSINRGCIFGLVFFGLISAVMITVLYFLTDSITAAWIGILFVLFVLAFNMFFILFLRHKLTLFSDRLCSTIDEMMGGKSQFLQVSEEESLFYKINHRLMRLYEIMQENKQGIAKERADLQELVSDISHQVKTPIANLQMINATLIEQEMPQEKRQEFLQAADGQLEKLNFLMQSMIKTSRLETGVISLEMKKQPIYDTLAAALGGILLGAEKKQIQVDVDCPEKLEVLHDRKWTVEALFNILDNAVKYTPEGGTIKVCVQSWELYMKIDIADSGKGIAENRQGKIFKRFYREEEVHNIDGIGIGLYLAREIVTMQGGYIKVSSEVGKGSVFSIFIPHG